MLYWLTEYLNEFYSFFNVFNYLSFRAILGVLTAVTISMVFGAPMIRKLNYLQIGQSVRDDGPQTHLSKSGTPTMGGTLILLSVFIATLLWADLSNRYVWVVLLVTVSFGIVGFYDDYKKVVERNPKGLSAKWKYFWQSVVGLAAAVYLFSQSEVPAETQLIVPFFKDVALDLGIGYILLTYFVVVGSSNAVNLTDGLDGLAILPCVMISGALGIIAYLAGHAIFAEYLHIPFIPCLLYTSPSPRDRTRSRMPSSA